MDCVCIPKAPSAPQDPFQPRSPAARPGLQCSRLGRDTTGQEDIREELQNHLLKQNQ